MKHLTYFFIFFLGAFTLNAQQNNSKEASNIDFYGVDFSMSKIIGEDDSVDKFGSVFSGINLLFVNEAKKYDLASFFDKDSVNIDLEAVRNINGAIDYKSLISYNPIQLSDSQIKSKINSYKLQPKNKLGLVIIVQNLNKPQMIGEYHIVFFDTKTREIISSKLMSAVPRGFGLRNFWAGSIYGVLKQYNN